MTNHTEFNYEKELRRMCNQNNYFFFAAFISINYLVSIRNGSV